MPAHKDARSPLCKVCPHPERVRIELMLAEGGKPTAVGKQFGLTRHSLTRHWAHVPENRKVALAVGPVKQAALAARVCDESESAYDHLKAVRAGLWSAFDAAVESGDAFAIAAIAGRLHENLNSMAKLTGQLASSPLVQYNTQINNGSNEKRQLEFLTRILNVLRPFKDARTAVIEACEADLQPAPAPRLISHNLAEVA